ncbi:ligase-associated DNA damage response exonuclease [Dinghuibacter silviterrae]|uniref:Putative mRNA 3-end processing factor n=1 Tax=Dinghuibacter silviterrae TaxID=1539049 RepID=A0A4R8DT40_9BACT|nr:ligase-associated DNA damage response exonuclease [Dinghuibacter silviterrae]TDX00575.1 putative mRNA 3-end processing factor [Dinghuibacter silviterrae]
MPLIEYSDRGLFCARGDFYIDPWKPVPRAVITHAHSDHARPGSAHYLCHTLSEPLLRLRLGPVSCQAVAWGSPVLMNGVSVSLHPAGHVIGSSQVRVEYKGEVWVVSGDYKLENDGLSGVFEPIRCHTFITESTFGLPIYRWQPQSQVFSAVEDWIGRNRAEGLTTVLYAYSLGKAQRLIQQLSMPLFAHGAVYNVQEALRAAGVAVPPVEWITPETPKERFKGQVVIAPPSSDDSPWLRRFIPYSLGIFSGWMQVRGNVRRRNADAGFVLSDHADWDGLLTAVRATGAEQVLVTHGFQSAFSRYLVEREGLVAAELQTAYGDEEEGTAASGGAAAPTPDAGPGTTPPTLNP